MVEVAVSIEQMHPGYSTLIFVLGALGGAALIAPAGAGSAPVPPIYPDRGENLLQLQEPGGPLRPIRSCREWERRRQQILAAMQRVMGELPGREKRVPLDVRVEWEQPGGRFIRRKLTYASAPGERVPAILTIPRGLRGRAPAALCLHQTVRIGKEEPAGMGGSANLHYARELAERGFVTLSPDYPGFGEHKTDVYARGWHSGTMKAIWDNIRAVDLLQSLPEADGDRIGCIGHSLGGHNTLFTAAFDTRIRAAVSNCGFTAFSRYYGGDLRGWSSATYMPRIGLLFATPERMPFEFSEVLGAIAPRALLAIAPERDDNFDVQGVRQVIDAAAPVYRLLGGRDRLEASYPDCGHDWPEPERGRAYAWLERWLR
jgi:dienelactone hydrolase